MQAAGLYLHIISTAFIWQAVWKMLVCYINLHLSLHSLFFISVWECINVGLNHKVCIWAFLVFGGVELVPEPEESPPPHITPESQCIAATPHHRIPSSAWIDSHRDFLLCFPTVSHQTVIWSRYWGCSETTSISSLTKVFAFRQCCNKKGAVIVDELNNTESLCSCMNIWASYYWVSCVCVTDKV